MTATAAAGSRFDFATLQVQFDPYLPTFLFGLVVIFVWGYLWSSSMRDEEKQPLPPSFAANTFFALSHCVVYLCLVLIGFLAPEFIRDLRLPGLSEIPEQFLKQIPLVAIILMGAMLSVPQIKEVAQRYAILLHSAQYRKNDEIVLQRHLRTCGFVPSKQEIAQNIDYIRQFDVYITDRDHTALHLDAVDSWRKVSSLLRLLKGESSSEKSIFSATEREEIARLDEAHRRKTRLAMNIVRLIEHMGASSDFDQKLTRIAAQLGDVSHQDRGGVQSAEELAREIATGFDIHTPIEQNRPLRLSMKQMNEYLSHVERYFLTEYQLILQDVSRLAARFIVHAGDLAPERLEEIKLAGFRGLGHIQRVSFDGVIWVLLSSFAIAFGGLTLLFTILQRPVNTVLVSSIALTVAIAALTGAVWGSRRSLAERRTTPWSSYLAAGLLAVLGFTFVHSTRFVLEGKSTLAEMADRFEKSMPKYIELNLISPDQALHYARETVLNWTLFDYLWQLWPFSVAAFFLTIGICWLARMKEWPWQHEQPWIERLSDGLATGFIYFLGGIASTLLAIALRTGSGLRNLQTVSDPEKGVASVFLSDFRLMSFLTGFLIGAIIVREVRHIAHVQLIADDEEETEAQPFATGNTESAASNVTPLPAKEMALR